MNEIADRSKLTPDDYATEQEVRWCPGCGDYAILKAMQKTLADLAAKPEETVFISGIGCSSRFPYYMATYGFHTIHGRAPAVATGTKLVNPDLDIWVVTGDGDGLSIGGNHMMHVLRRNVDLQILLFNNEVYGLTKGQYSPTSRPGQITPSSPSGSVDAPVSPCPAALGMGAGFVARGIDTDIKGLVSLFKDARAYKGAAFVEILQNCLIYNDGVFEAFKDKKQAKETLIRVEHGKPLVFGAAQPKGLAFDMTALDLKIVDVEDPANPPDNVLVHDETNTNLAAMLAAMKPPFPLAVGVIYRVERPSFEDAVRAQIRQIDADPATVAATAHVDIDKLLRSGAVWTVGTS